MRIPSVLRLLAVGLFASSVAANTSLKCDKSSVFTSSVTCKTLYGTKSCTEKIPTVTPVTTTTRTFQTTIIYTSTVYASGTTPTKTVTVKAESTSYSTSTKYETAVTTRTEPAKVTTRVSTITSTSVDLESRTITETFLTTETIVADTSTVIDESTTEITSTETLQTTSTTETTTSETYKTTQTDVALTTTTEVETSTIWVTQQETITLTISASTTSTEYQTDTFYTTRTTVIQTVSTPTTVTSYQTVTSISTILPGGNSKAKRIANALKKRSNAKKYATKVECTLKRGLSLTCSRTTYKTTTIKPPTKTVTSTITTPKVIKTTITTVIATRTNTKDGGTLTRDETTTVDYVSDSTTLLTVQTTKTDREDVTSTVTSSTVIYVYKTVTQWVTSYETAVETVKTTETWVTEVTSTITEETTTSTTATTTETDTTSTSTTSTIDETSRTSETLTSVIDATTTVPSPSTTTLTSTTTQYIVLPTWYRLVCVFPGGAFLESAFYIGSQRCNSVGSGGQTREGWVITSMNGQVRYPYSRAQPFTQNGVPSISSGYSIQWINSGTPPAGDQCFFNDGQRGNFVDIFDFGSGIAFKAGPTGQFTWFITTGDIDGYHTVGATVGISAGGLCAAGPYGLPVMTQYLMTCNAENLGVFNFRFTIDGSSPCGTGGWNIKLGSFHVVNTPPIMNQADIRSRSRIAPGGLSVGGLTNNNCFYNINNLPYADANGIAWYQGNYEDYILREDTAAGVGRHKIMRSTQPGVWHRAGCDIITVS